MEDPKQSMGGILHILIISMCNVVLDRLPVLTLEVTLQSFVELFETLCCPELGSELCKKGLLGGGSAGMSARPSLLNTS